MCRQNKYRNVVAYWDDEAIRECRDIFTRPRNDKMEKIFSPHCQLAMCVKPAPLMLRSGTTAREACTILMLCTGTTGHVYLHLCPAAKTTGPVLLHLRVAPVANHLLRDHDSLYLRLHMQGISPRVLWEFLVKNPRYIPWV
ncbi:hypothetical protein V6N13_129554 [Hibiscus sabdariffa]